MLNYEMFLTENVAFIAYLKGAKQRIASKCTKVWRCSFARKLLIGRLKKTQTSFKTASRRKIIIIVQYYIYYSATDNPHSLGPSLSRVIFSSFREPLRFRFPVFLSYFAIWFLKKMAGFEPRTPWSPCSARFL